jgi:zinc protease
MTADRHGNPRVMHPPRLGPPPAPRAPQPERSTLPNGLRVVAIPRGGMPQVAMKLVVPAGSAADPAARFGMAALVGNLLTEGTEHYTAEALNARLDSLGAAISVQTGHDLLEIEALALSETLADTVPLFADLVMRPTFPVREVERVRAETLDALEARQDEPANVADDRTAHELFGPAHPYGRISMGTPAGVAACVREELLEFHARHYCPTGSFLVVAGDFAVADLFSLLQREFASWSGAAARVSYPAEHTTPHRGGRRIDIPWRDAAQAEIRVAARGLSRCSPDWIVASVANYILGGSTITGRLGANLREDKGWTYGARSSFAAAIQPGGWIAETAVDVEVADSAVDEMLREIRTVGEELVGEAELQRSKDALILSLPRAFETPSRIVNRFSTLEAFDLPDDYWTSFPDQVAAVTAEDVRRTAHSLFDPAHLVCVVVGSSFRD